MGFGNFQFRMKKYFENLGAPKESTIVASTPSNSPTGNPYLDSLIWGGSWNLVTNYGGAAGTLTYAFQPIDYGTGTTYPWLSWEKQGIRSALDTIEAIIDVSFVEVEYVSNPSGYYENFTFSLFIEDSDTLGEHQPPADQPHQIGPV